VKRQPNFNGLGIKSNNIIDDVVKRAERKSREYDDQ